MQHGFSRNTKQEALPNAVFGHESKNWTALHEAVVAGDEKRVEALLASSNVDRLAKESICGNTPLHEAAARGLSRCVKLICAPPVTKSQHKEKNRLKARAANTIEALHNSTLGITNNDGLSALHLAVQHGHNQSTRELLMAGADPDVQNNYGDTPLHTACRYGHAGATRILLSALCDPNKTNLNGDTALHITCAMGRRKLTRILLEADTKLNIKNAQGETAQNIAFRKNFREIFEILNTPKRMRNRKSKDNKKETEPKSTADENADKVVNWSPYGCHYFPDPRAFPSPRLETLPKEPLKPGEQYFLDLAGNIHKGPVSVGNTCYCGPFFRHIENKLHCNRKSLKKYKHKVQALAIKTNDQIEQLTRTMIADRIRCENKRQFLNEFLQRGEPLRATYDNQSKKRIERTFSRCRSLELLDSTMTNRTLANSRSVELLENQPLEVVVDHHHDLGAASGTDDDDDDDDDLSVIVDQTPRDENICSENIESTKLSELKLDFLKVSERLGDLLEKTTLIIERDSEQENNKNTLASISPSNCKSQPSPASGQIMYNNTDEKDSPISPNFENYAHIMRRYPNSSETSNPSQNSNSWECETSPTGSQPTPDLHKYYHHHHKIGKGESALHNVIKALRKDQSFDELIGGGGGVEIALNEKAESENKLLYKQELLTVDPPVPTSETIYYAQSQKHNKLMRQRQLQNCNLQNLPSVFYANPVGPQMGGCEVKQPEVLLQMRQNATNEAAGAGKIEIRNSEIKCLKKSNTGQVRDIVAQLQGKIDTQTDPIVAASHPQQHSSNLDHERLRMSGCQPLVNGIRIGQQLHSPSPYVTSAGTSNYDRHIPKDAYFHELPNRPSPHSPRNHINSPPPPLESHFPRELIYGQQQFVQRRQAIAVPIETHDVPTVMPPRDYVNRNGQLLVQSSAPANARYPNAAHPLIWRSQLSPNIGLQNAIDAEDSMPTIGGMYNNVSSLV